MVDLVDPFIGVDGGGNCLPGPCRPLGMVRLSPDVAPPHDTNGYATGKPITCFSHTHVSGTGGLSRYGNVGVTPFVGPVRPHVDPQTPFDEEAEVGRYAVTLGESRVRVELTATDRVGIHRIRFPDGADRHVLIDGGSVMRCGYWGLLDDPNGWRARSIGGWIEKMGDRAVGGRCDLVGGWGHDRPYSVFFYAEFDTPCGFQFADDDGLLPGDHIYGAHSKAIASFEASAVELRVGISFVSVAQARASVDREARKPFDHLVRDCREAWAAAFSPVSIEGGSDSDRTLFATSFLRLFTMPTDLGVDDEFSGWRSGVRHFSDFYCLWDSVRNANSLIALLRPDLHADFVNCLLDVGEKTGWVPDAWVAGHSAFRQGGSSWDVLVAEAAQKGIDGIDFERALRQGIKGAESPSPDPYLHGRYPHEPHVAPPTPHCVSRHLEYRFQDWCIAQTARCVGQTDVAERFEARARDVWTLWSDHWKAFAPRDVDGRWSEPFHPDAHHFAHPIDPYCYEGSSRQWSFNVQHDLQGLVERHGGDEAFVAHLDTFLFAEPGPPPTPPLRQGDRYHSKETMLHVPFLYHQVGRPDLSAKAARWAMDRFFSVARDGLKDNEDMGCQSAFFMGAAMGLTPLMGRDLYVLTPPAFDRVEIRLGDRPFVISRRGEGSAIAELRLNGESIRRPWLRHAELAGAELEVTLGEAGGGWESLPNGV